MEAAVITIPILTALSALAIVAELLRLAVCELADILPEERVMLDIVAEAVGKDDLCADEEWEPEENADEWLLDCEGKMAVAVKDDNAFAFVEFIPLGTACIIFSVEFWSLIPAGTT